MATGDLSSASGTNFNDCPWRCLRLFCESEGERPAISARNPRVTGRPLETKACSRWVEGTVRETRCQTPTDGCIGAFADSAEASTATRSDHYQASNTAEWKLTTVKRSRSRAMTPSLPAKGPATARCATSATSKHVLNISATCTPSSSSGQGFAVNHAVASLVAASSSSAAANIVILFTLIDAENRCSAAVTRLRTDLALKRHCETGVGAWSMVIGCPMRAHFLRLVTPKRQARPYGDSGFPVLPSIGPFVSEAHNPPTTPAGRGSRLDEVQPFRRRSKGRRRASGFGR
jgi:predicted GNAT family acetyltransferase